METNLIPSKEAFVRTIKAIKAQKEREENFGNTIKQAFIDAGECEDFRDHQSYEPPTNVFIDELLEAISFNFVGPYQNQEDALDHINYYVYELELINYVFMEPEDPEHPFEMKPVPAYYIAKDGLKLPLATPEDLYESLIYEMSHPGRKTVDREYRKDWEPQHAEQHSEWENEKQRLIWDKLRPIIEDKLGVEDVNETQSIGYDLGADSLDCVELCMDIEKEFGIHLTDDEYYRVEAGTSCRELVELIEKKQTATVLK